ncbi:MAG: MFS transporter [Woeseiaceae bacterium]|nr:MFS transporter [Woeseiaceae bacterium]
MTESRHYYGWWVLAGLFLVYAATNGILMHTLPLLYPQLMSEFGWSEVDVTLPATVLFVISAVTSPPVGALLDRYSPRRIIITGVSGMAIGLALYAQVTALWQLVAVYALLAVSLSLSGLVSNMVVLSRWFFERRGRATGILLMASSFGGAVFPLVLGATMAGGDWRSSLYAFAGITVVLTMLPLMFVIRDRPPTATSERSSAVRPTPPPGIRLLQALRQSEFYLIAIATAAVWFSIIAMVQHQSIYLARDVGIDAAQLPRLFSVFFACSVVGKFGFGWLSDRLDKGLTMSLSVATLIAGLLLLRHVDAAGGLSVFGFAVVAGIGFSGAFTTIQLLIARFYAGIAYGKILALLVLMDTLAGALGTRVVGQMRTTLGSYLPAIDLMIGCCVVAIGCVEIVRRGRLYRSAM